MMTTTLVLSALTVLLRKRSKLLLPPAAPGGQEPKNAVTLVATFNRNLNTLGYTLSEPLLKGLAKLSKSDIDDVYREVFGFLAARVGADRQYRVMYPNFPKQVMGMGEAELYLNALAHYFGSAVADTLGVSISYLPEYQVDPRNPLPAEEMIPLKVIGAGEERDLFPIFSALLSSNGSLSPEDKEILTWFIHTYTVVPERRDGESIAEHTQRRLAGSLREYVPAVIPQKENLAVFVGEMMKAAAKKDPEIFSYLLRFPKTATDVLRIAEATSGGDVSLAKPGKLRKFSRVERRFLLAAIDQNASDPVEDMIRRPEHFKRLGHALHSGEYAKKYPRAFVAFDVVRNDVAVSTVNSRVEKNLKERNVSEAITDLLRRPGDFARRLDHLLRTAEERGPVLDAFESVALQVSTPVLLQAYAHFRSRSENRNFRAFFPKGDTAKVQTSNEAFPALPGDTAQRASEIFRNALLTKFSTLPKLGPCYLDERLKTQFVPFAMRSASKSLRTLVRGSRMSLPEGAKTLRFFIWWKDGKDRTDIDLSAVYLDENFRYRGAIAYWNLKEGGVACHSGDITAAPNGASEFIDLKIESSRKQGRYVAMVVNSFTQQPYKDLPECFAGWMARTAVQSGEIYEPRTVQDKIDLASDSKVSIPLIFDLEKREAIWMDLSLRSVQAVNNVRRNSHGIEAMAKAIVNLPKPTLHDLFSLHIEARGSLAPREEAETVFSLHEGITPFDHEKIMGEFMGDLPKT